MRFLCAALVASSLACAGVKGEYVWVQDYTMKSRVGSGLAIEPGDLLQVRVYNQEGMSARTRVRSDGKITLPFLNDVVAAGYAPAALGQQLQTRFKDFVNAAVVTVTLEERAPLRVSVIGEVTKPGLYTLEPGSGVLEALAQSGGLTEFAHRDRLFVLRGVPPERIRFTYESLETGEKAAGTFRLRPGDALVVE